MISNNLDLEKERQYLETKDRRDRKLISCLREAYFETLSLKQTIQLIKEEIGETLDRDYVKKLRNIMKRLDKFKLTMNCKYCYKDKVPIKLYEDGSVLDCCNCGYHIALSEDLLEPSYWE